MDVTTTAVDVARPEARPNLPNPKPIETSPMKWEVVVIRRNEDGTFSIEGLPEGDVLVYYGLAPEQYEVLARNMADILRWVKEAAWRLDYYRGEGSLDGHGAGGTPDGHADDGGAD